MKKLLVLLTLVFVVFIIVHRQRLFLLDPLGTVTRDGVRVSHVTVMINYTNDVLLRDASSGALKLYLVQEWNHQPEVPTSPLTCVEKLACLTDQDHATADPITPVTGQLESTRPRATMTNRDVEFLDEKARDIRVHIW